MRYYIDGIAEDEDKAATLSSMLPKVENIVKSHIPHACKCSLYLLHLFNFPHYQNLLISNDGNISFVLSHHSQKTSLLFCHITRKKFRIFFKNIPRVRMVDKYQSHLFLSSCSI